jgi:hypothetical protein
MNCYSWDIKSANAQKIKSRKGEITMTTQTEVTRSNQAIQVLLPKKASLWLWVLAVLLIISVVSATLLVVSSKDVEISGNTRALEADSARYQGMADFYANTEVLGTQRAMDAMSARYRGLADFYANTEKSGTQRAMDAMAARYRGLADFYAASEQGK